MKSRSCEPEVTEDAHEAAHRDTHEGAEHVVGASLVDWG
jgi:hypothetical protein